MAQTALLDLRSFAFHDMFHERPSATAGRPRLHGAMKPWSLDANRIDENNRYSMIQHDNEYWPQLLVLGQSASASSARLLPVPTSSESSATASAPSKSVTSPPVHLAGT